MKESTVNDYVFRIQRILANSDPPWLEAVARNGHKYDNGTALTYKVLRDPRDIKVDTLVSGIDALFPSGVTDDVAANYRHYQQAAVCLGRYLVYQLTHRDKPIWKTQDLEELRERVPSYSVQYTDIEIVDPERFDAFLAWLKTAAPLRKEDPDYRELHDAAFALRWLGLRWSGMVGAPKDLRGKTVKLARGHLEIWEKHRPRKYEAPEVVLEFLEERQAYMAKTWPDCDTLFCNTKGRPWHRTTTAFNHTLRKAWTRWEEEENHTQADLDDIDALHAHALRHICGTYWVKIGVPLPVVKNYLGHADYRVLDIYVRHVTKSSGDLMNQAIAAANGGD
jgi:integrase